MSIADGVQQIDGTLIVRYDATAAALAALKERLGGVVYDCTDAKQDKAARQDRAELVSLGSALEAKRKEIKAPYLDLGRTIDVKAAEYDAEIEALKAPIDAQIKQEERRKAAVKAAEEAAEAVRVAEIRGRIRAIAQRSIDALKMTIEQLEQAVQQQLTGEFSEFAADAAHAWSAAQASIESTLAVRIQARDEAAELARQRAELAAQAEAARLEQAARQAELDREREAERAAFAEAQRLEREAASVRAAEAKRINDAREAELKLQREADAAALAKERAKIEAEAEANRAAINERHRQACEEIAAARAAAEAERAKWHAAEAASAAERERLEHKADLLRIEELRAKFDAEAAEEAEAERIAELEAAKLSWLHRAAPMMLEALKMALVCLQDNNLAPFIVEKLQLAIEAAEGPQS